MAPHHIIAPWRGGSNPWSGTVVSAEKPATVTCRRSYQESNNQFSGRGLTLRSSGPPTACHHARAGGTRYNFTSPGRASRCRGPLSSNVRPRRRHLPLLKLQLLGFASAKHQPRLLPRGAGLLSPAWRQAALAIPHRFVFGCLQRAKAACGTVRCALRATATFIASATNRAGVA